MRRRFSGQWHCATLLMSHRFDKMPSAISVYIQLHLFAMLCRTIVVLPWMGRGWWVVVYFIAMSVFGSLSLWEPLLRVCTMCVRCCEHADFCVDVYVRHIGHFFFFLSKEAVWNSWDILYAILGQEYHPNQPDRVIRSEPTQQYARRKVSFILLVSCSL